MSGSPNITRQAARRQATIDEILDAAWEQVRERGLAGLALRDLGERVGMRAQSLYSYFASKHEIYDAMFLQANEAFVEWMSEGSDPAVEADPVERIRRMSRRFLEFCVSDPVRHQLLFQRTIPEFVPSARSYAVAQQAYEISLEPLRALGARDADIDLWTAVLAGLAAQQLSNDPGGDRWARLVDVAVDLVLTRITSQRVAPEPTRSTR